MIGIIKSLSNIIDRKSQFKIEETEGFYFTVKLNKTVICHTRENEKAEELINKLVETGYNWGNVRDLNSLREEDPHFYERIRPIFRTYAVPYEFNGNYMSTLRDGNTVRYKLSNGKVVSGVNLVDGLAIRVHNSNYHMDNAYSGRTVVVMDSEDKIKRLYEETKQYIPWQIKTINEAIEKEIEIKSYLERVKDAINKNEDSIPSPTQREMNKFQFIVLGGTDEDKMKVFEAAMNQLNDMIGLASVKNKIVDFIKSEAANRQLKKLNLNIGEDTNHSLFVGPPGTGKTEVARIMRDIFWSLDMINDRKLVELSKEDLVSSHIGGTEEITKEKVEEAVGGILFVDEAYMLKNSGDNEQDYGKIALEIIMRKMENIRGKDLVVIFAGYRKEIDDLLNSNPGLRSRFAHSFEFEQFTPFELNQIADRMLTSKGFYTGNINDALKELITKKAKTGALQGNARDIRVLSEEILRRHKVRIVDQNGELTVIHPEVIESMLYEGKIKDSEGLRSLKDEAEAELGNLIGLKNIKEEVISWANYITVEKRRIQDKNVSAPMKLHMSFEGDPGVGKTTVARIIAKILKGNGMLSSGHLVEVVGKDLVAGYMGQTSNKVKDIVKSALGGILFIDEAYSLVKGENDTFGREAVDTLIAEMDNKSDFVVILAGYTKQIEELFDSNPGFKSRVLQRFNFKNYNSDELVEIFKIKAKEINFKIEDGALSTLITLIFEAKEKNQIDGNARWIRNLLEKVKFAQANRIIRDEESDLYSIKEQDILEGFKKM